MKLKTQESDFWVMTRVRPFSLGWSDLDHCSHGGGPENDIFFLLKWQDAVDVVVFWKMWTFTARPKTCLCLLWECESLGFFCYLFPEFYSSSCCDRFSLRYFTCVFPSIQFWFSSVNSGTCPAHSHLCLIVSSQVFVISVRSVSESVEH